MVVFSLTGMFCIILWGSVSFLEKAFILNLPFYEGLMKLCDAITLSQTNSSFYVSFYRSFENTVERGEIPRNDFLLLFPQYLYPFNFAPFS